VYLEEMRSAFCLIFLTVVIVGYFVVKEVHADKKSKYALAFLLGMALTRHQNKPNIIPIPTGGGGSKTQVIPIPIPIQMGSNHVQEEQTDDEPEHRSDDVGNDHENIIDTGNTDWPSAKPPGVRGTYAVDSRGYAKTRGSQVEREMQWEKYLEEMQGEGEMEFGGPRHQAQMGSDADKHHPVDEHRDHAEHLGQHTDQQHHGHRHQQGHEHREHGDHGRDNHSSENDGGTRRSGRGEFLYGRKSVYPHDSSEYY